MKPRISIVTPTVRPEGLAMVNACLGRQTLQDWEWLIAAPESMLHRFGSSTPKIKVMAEPPKREGDFYALNKAWNKLIGEAQCELLVFAVDWIWFEDDALMRFWKHFEANPGVGINSIGHHYRQVVRGRPEVLWQMDTWAEQLARNSPELWEGLPPGVWDNAFCSLSRSKLLEVGGYDEEYDKVAGNSEKEAATRMYAAGYRLQLDIDIERRNYTHAKTQTTAQWDEAFLKACDMLRRHHREIMAGERRVATNLPEPTPVEAQ